MLDDAPWGASDIGVMTGRRSHPTADGSGNVRPLHQGRLSEKNVRSAGMNLYDDAKHCSRGASFPRAAIPLV